MATGLFAAFDYRTSHDNVTCFPSSSYLDNRAVWKAAKGLVRQRVPAWDTSGVILVDDYIVEKARTDDHPLISSHWDNSMGRHVRGINFVSLLFSHDRLDVPIQVRPIEKTVAYQDKKTGKTNYRSAKTKNEHLREMLQAAKEQVRFKYVLADYWYSSTENLGFITKHLGKHAVIAVKENRRVALSETKRGNGESVRVGHISQLQEGIPLNVYLRRFPDPVRLVKQVFVSQNARQGTRYLFATDLSMSYEAITSIYEKPRKGEEYHQSLKQHTALGGSLTETIETQGNHFFAAIVAYAKLVKF